METTSNDAARDVINQALTRNRLESKGAWLQNADGGIRVESQEQTWVQTLCSNLSVLGFKLLPYFFK